MKKIHSFGLLIAPALLLLATTARSQTASLKDVFRNDFMVGAALNPSEFGETSPAKAEIVKKQFNTITPENVLKWGAVHPAADRFNFQTSDRYVAFGETNHMFIIGHNLIWHNQTPAWVFRGADGQPISREALIERMSNHIFTVVGRYKGRIGGWDVVNEALNDDGTPRDSQWRRIIGDDYLTLAFRFAHEADPNAQLYYNDYSLENEPKRNGAVALVKKLQADGVKIFAVGSQEHDNLDWPTTNQVDETITAFSRLGVKVMITELDIDMLPRRGQAQTADVSARAAGGAGMNPYTNGLPDSVRQKLAQRYADLFSVFKAHRGEITRVTFWGVTDADTWLNDFPIAGRTAYPLLFGRDNNPKPAFDAVIKVGEQGK